MGLGGVPVHVEVGVHHYTCVLVHTCGCVVGAWLCTFRLLYIECVYLCGVFVFYIRVEGYCCTMLVIIYLDASTSHLPVIGRKIENFS